MRGRWLFASLLVVASCSTASIAVVGGSDEDAGDAGEAGAAAHVAYMPDAAPRCTTDPALTGGQCGYDRSLLATCFINRALVSCISPGKGGAICLNDGKVDCYGRPLVDSTCVDECCSNEYAAACTGAVPPGCRAMGAVPAGFQYVCCTCEHGPDAAPPETAERCSSEWTTPPPACSFDASITSGITDDDASACHVERMGLACAFVPDARMSPYCSSDGSADCYGQPFVPDAGPDWCNSTCCPGEYVVTCSPPGYFETPPGCRTMRLTGGGGGTFCCPCR